MQTLRRLSLPSLVGTFIVIASLDGQCAEWWLEAGPMVRGGMKVEVKGSTYVQSLGLFQATTAPATAPRDGIGSFSGFADRTYDNGYVKMDPGTGVSPIDPNTTWNWGFNDAAANHYNAANQTLGFRKSYLPTSNRNGNDEDMLAGGLHLLTGVPLSKSEHWSVDLAFGFQAVWGSASPSLGAQQLTVNDTYDVSATVADGYDFSTADGHHGTYNGPFDNPAAPGTIIPNQPGSSSLVTSVNKASFQVDQGLYQISVGPQIGFAATEHLRFNLRPSISLNIMDVDVERSETFVQTTSGSSGRVPLHTRWSDEEGKTKASFGLGVTGGASWEFGKGYYTGLFGGYEWIPERVKVAVGPNLVSVDGSGFVAGLVFGKKF